MRQCPERAWPSAPLFNSSSGRFSNEPSRSPHSIRSEKRSTKLAEVNLPVRLVSISAGAFRSCRAITEIVIPEGVESIGAEAFQWCSSLVRVSLPKTLSSLGYTESGSELYMYVFRYCNALEEINVASDNAKSRALEVPPNTH